MALGCCDIVCVDRRGKSVVVVEDNEAEVGDAMTSVGDRNSIVVVIRVVMHVLYVQI